jgi:predicted phosphodiesterase
MEGFVSQGGKNAWRTELTLTEQLRLTRRLFLYAIDQFAPLTERLTVVSVPGNHDEAVRSPGMTTYDDSFAVDALVAVTDAMQLNPAVYGHVETFIPRRDELSVTLDVNGTVLTHYHGHQHRRGKHWEWWQGSSFDRRYPDLYQADVALSAHGHTFQLDTKGDRTWIMTPAQEQESTWWRHRTGDRGAPGALIFTTEGGRAGGFTIV